MCSCDLLPDKTVMSVIITQGEELLQALYGNTLALYLNLVFGPRRLAYLLGCSSHPKINLECAQSKLRTSNFKWVVNSHVAGFCFKLKLWCLNILIKQHIFTHFYTNKVGHFLSFRRWIKKKRNS